MSHIKVAVRVRPLNTREIETQAKVIVEVNRDTISITNPRLDSSTTQLDVIDSRERIKSFVFDYAYLSTERSASNYAAQPQIFQDVGSEVLEAAFDGYNACIFAYGQTGSGKTYTMMGNEGEEAGLTPRILQGLFARVNEAQEHPECSISCRVDVSYMEIYNEKVRDLLRPSASKRGQGNERFTLKVREHPKDGPYVQDLSRHIVKDNESVQALLDKGNEKRITAATHYHDHSSRSHAIFTINFTQAKLEKGLPCETVSKIHLVDLAGSERANLTDYDRERLKEGANINKSLVTLGNVIKSLELIHLRAYQDRLANQSASFGTSHENLTGSLIGSSQGLLASCELLNRSSSPTFRKKSSAAGLFVPYRDSVLTWLLKDSLGGNSKTIMIANISPSSLYYAETLNTLRYAQRTKSIINKPTVNEDANVKLIRDLRGEINRLRELLVSSHMAQSPALMDIDSSLVEKLEENEAVAKSMLSNWLDKWQEAHDIMKESDIMIRRGPRKASSMGVIVDSQLPHLVGIDDDILSTGVIIYHIRVGTTTVGSEDADRRCDIVLHGPGIQTEHCIIKYTDNNVYLLPHFQASCSVNGVDITEATKLTQGDVILLGKTNMFRFNNPSEAAHLRKKRKSLNDIGLERRGSHLEMLFRASMSHSNSVSSLVTAGVECDTPSLRNKAVDNAVQDLDAFYHSEVERIQNAKEELERLQVEHAAAEEERARKEEQLMLTHERKVLEMERLERHLQLMIAENDAMRVRAEEEIRQARLQLDQERQEHQEQLARDLAELTELRQKQRASCSSSPDENQGVMTTQTDELESLRESIETQTDNPEVLAEVSNNLVSKQRSTVQGRLKELTQKELIFTLQEFEEEQDISNKALEYELQITDAQDEIYDVKYHLNELKHSISFNNFEDASGEKIKPDDQSDDPASDDDCDTDLDRSHDLAEYMANEKAAMEHDSPDPTNEMDTEVFTDEQLSNQPQAGSDGTRAKKLSVGRRVTHSLSPDRFKVSRGAESVTSRLFPQYQVKFEYKAPVREATPSPVRDGHQRRHSEPRSKVDSGVLRRSARSLSSSHTRPQLESASLATKSTHKSVGRKNKKDKTGEKVDSDSSTSRRQANRQPANQRPAGNDSLRSQSQPNFSSKPRRTWERPDPHNRSRSVPTDLTRLAQPRNPLPPVKRTLVSERNRVPSPSELKRSRKVKKATSLSRIPETHSDEEKSKSYMNIGSLPAFGTCNLSENPAYTESLTHSLDFNSAPFNQLLPKLPIVPSEDESDFEAAPDYSPRVDTLKSTKSKRQRKTGGDYSHKKGSKPFSSSKPAHSILSGIRSKYNKRRPPGAEIPVEIFLPPSPLSAKEAFSGGYGGGGGGGSVSPSPSSGYTRSYADKEIFIPFDRNTMLFAKTLRDQQRKPSQSDSAGTSSRRSSTNSCVANKGGSTRRASHSPTPQQTTPENFNLTQEQRAQSATELRNTMESSLHSNETDMNQLEQQYQNLLDTHSDTDITPASKAASGVSQDVASTHMAPSESVLELHSSASFASIQEVDCTTAAQIEEVSPLVQFYENGELVTEESLAKRQQMAKEALKATQVKYLELEDAVIRKKKSRKKRRATKARQQSLNKPEEDTFSEDSLKGEQHAARLARRKRRSSSANKPVARQPANAISLSDSEDVLSEDSLTEPVIKRSSSAQKLTEELFHLREEFMDSKFGVKKSMVVESQPSWNCVGDSAIDSPKITSFYNTCPSTPKPICMVDTEKLTVTAADIWSTLYSVSPSSGKYMVTGRTTNKHAKPGVCTQSKTDVWGSIHPTHEVGVHPQAIVVHEAHCQSSEEGLEVQGGLRDAPLTRSRVSVISFDDAESSAKDSVATTTLLAGAPSDTCSVSTNDLMADVSTLNSASSDTFTINGQAPADTNQLLTHSGSDQVDFITKTSAASSHSATPGAPANLSSHLLRLPINIKEDVEDSDDTDELLSCRPINTAEELLQTSQRRFARRHQSHVKFPSTTGTCQGPVDTCHNVNRTTSLEEVARLMVDDIIKRSLVFLSEPSAVIVTEEMEVTECYFSDSSSEKSANKRYHELVAVSSKIFAPDGTAVHDEPLHFNDPPFKSDSLLAISETVELNGSGVQVIAVPWDVGVAPLPRLSKNDENLAKSNTVESVETTGLSLCRKPEDIQNGHHLEHDAACAEETITPTNSTPQSYSKRELVSDVTDDFDGGLNLADTPVPLPVLAEAGQYQLEDTKNAITLSLSATPTKDTSSSGLISANVVTGKSDDVAEELPTDSEETESESRSDGSYLLDHQSVERDSSPTEVKDISASSRTPLYMVEEQEPAVEGKKINDKLEDSAISSDWTEEVELANQRISRENVGLYQPNHREQHLLSDSGNGSDKADTPPPQFEGGEFLSANTDSSVAETGDEETCETSASPRTASLSSGESITFVFMTRSYSADEVNGASSHSDDIDANQLFGGFGLDADEVLGSKAEVPIVRYVSEPNLHSKSDNDLSPRDSGSPRSLTLFADSIHLNSDTDSNADRTKSLPQTLPTHTDTDEETIPPPPGYVNPGVEPSELKPVAREEIESLANTLRELEEGQTIEELDSNDTSQCSEPVIVSSLAAAEQRTSAEHSHPDTLSEQQTTPPGGVDVNQLPDHSFSSAENVETTEVSELGACYTYPHLSLPHELSSGNVAADKDFQLFDSDQSDDDKAVLANSRVVDVENISSDCNDTPLSAPLEHPGQFGEIPKVKVTDEEGNSNNSPSFSSSERMFTAESVAEAIKDMLAQSPENNSDAPELSQVREENTDKPEDAAIQQYMDTVHKVTVQPQHSEPDTGTHEAEQSTGTGKDLTDTKRKARSLELTKSELLGTHLPAAADTQPSAVEEDLLRRFTPPNHHEQQSSDKVEEWLSRQNPLDSPSTELSSSITQPLQSPPTKSSALEKPADDLEQTNRPSEEMLLVNSTCSLHETGIQSVQPQGYASIQTGDRISGATKSINRGDSCPEREDNDLERDENNFEKNENSPERHPHYSKESENMPEGAHSIEIGILANMHPAELVDRSSGPDGVITCDSQTNGLSEAQPTTADAGTEAIQTSNQGTDAMNKITTDQETETPTFFVSKDAGTSVNSDGHSYQLADRNTTIAKSNDQGTDTSDIEDVIHLRHQPDARVLTKESIADLIDVSSAVSPQRRYASQDLAVQTDDSITTQTEGYVHVSPRFRATNNELCGSTPALGLACNQNSGLSGSLPLSRSWASQTDALNVPEASKRVTSAGSLTFDMTTMTDFQEAKPVRTTPSCLSFDMQTSTSDLLADKYSTSAISRPKTKKHKLATVGKGLSRRSSRSSIQDVLDMLPTGTQTSGSLWGMESLPLFDASVRTNEDLVQAVSSTLDPNIACLEVELDQIDRLIKRAEQLRKAKLELLSGQGTEASTALPVSVATSMSATGTITPSTVAEAGAPLSSQDLPLQLEIPTSTDSLHMPADDLLLMTGPQAASTAILDSMAAPLMPGYSFETDTEYRLSDTRETTTEMELGDSRSSCHTIDSTVSSSKSRPRSSRKAQIQELLKSVDATLAKYGVTAPTSAQTQYGVTAPTSAPTQYGVTAPTSAQTPSASRASDPPLEVETTSRSVENAGVGRDYVLERSIASPSMSVSSSTVRDEQTDVDLDELDRLRKERLKITQILGKDYLPSRMWMELAEAQLNYAFGQTDTLLEALELPKYSDEKVSSQNKRHSMGSFLSALNHSEVRASNPELVRLRTQQLEDSKKKIEQRIEQLETKVSEKIEKGDRLPRADRGGSLDRRTSVGSWTDRGSRIGSLDRGLDRQADLMDNVDGASRRSSFRGSNMLSLAKARRQAEIEIFKIERERENSLIKSQTERYDLGNIDTISLSSARSTVSNSGTITPREHLRRLTNERKQVVSETVKGETGSSSPKRNKPHGLSGGLYHNTRGDRPMYQQTYSTTKDDEAIEVLRRQLERISRGRSYYSETRSTKDDYAIERLRRYMESSQPMMSPSRHTISTSHTIKSSEEIERQIQDELDKLNDEYSVHSSGTYRLHDPHDSRSYSSSYSSQMPSSSSVSSMRMGLLHAGRVARHPMEPNTYNYKNSSVSSLARTISQIRNYGVSSRYQRKKYY